jgi:phosphoenolpyruvate carboxykinase (ATP)
MSVDPKSILKKYGIETTGKSYRNLNMPELVEHALRREEGFLASNGGLVTRTGIWTGRSPDAKFTVRDAATEEGVWWDGPNKSTTHEHFKRINAKVLDYMKDKDLFIFDGFVNADPKLRMPIRVITELAWSAMFSQTQFRNGTREELENFEPEMTLFHVPLLMLDAEKDGTGLQAGVLMDYTNNLILVAGSGYCGEIKKSIFTALNFIMPTKGVLPMHCSANVGKKGDTALFFGLSGTGKTSLSADPGRRLIGDDEHGWGPDGIFNFEGGCYAKLIRISLETEPQIFNAIRFGSVLENVVVDEDRVPDYFDPSITENTRGTYPLEHIDNVEISARGGHPKNVVFLTADAFGLLPPLSRLTPAQAAYQFISGYTAKLAGTERGINEPKATFSACFGLPFLPRHPGVYADMLMERAAKHGNNFWLANTGWSGGPYGVGERMPIKLTRALLNAAVDGELDNVKFEQEAAFGLSIPTECPGADAKLLSPRNTWPDAKAYDEKAKDLRGMFEDNFKKYEANVSPEVVAAGFKR